MAWDDWVFGALTGGLYNLGKSAVNAMGGVGDAAEEAGVAIANIGSTVETLGKQLTSLLKETEELITIKRSAPRDEADLWDEEKELLEDLRQQRDEIKAQLRELGVDEPSSFTFDFSDMFSDFQNIMKKFSLISKLTAVNLQIKDILYQEPGVLTTGIYNAKEVLERFNTIEQPMIEDVLEGIDSNLDVSEDVLEEVKKLFVTKKRYPVLEADLTPIQKDRLEWIGAEKNYFQSLVSRNSTISSSLSGAILSMKVPEMTILPGSITSAGALNIHDNVNIADSSVSLVDDIRDTVLAGDVRDISRGDAARDTVRAGDVRDISRGDAARDTVRAGDVRDISRGDAVGNISGSNLSATSSGHISERIARTEINSAKTEHGAGGSGPASSEMPASDTAFSANGLKMLNAALLKDLSTVRTPAMVIPQGAKVSAHLNTKFDGYAQVCSFYKAKNVFFEREISKLERMEGLIRYRWEETPGVVPRTLEQAHDVLDRFHDEEQPRVEAVLDNLNENLEESKQTFSKVNDTLDLVQGVLSGVENKYVKYGLMAIGGLILLNLVLGLIVLVRISLLGFT